MVSPEAVVLGVHVAAGVVALVAGFGALVTAKGGRRHRFAGRTFLRAMAVVVGSVIPLFAFDLASFFRQFLLLVAVFSGYLAFSGYRVLSRKRPADDAQAVDWIAAGLVVVACLGLGGWGLRLVVGGNPFGVVMVAFGAIGLSFGVSDVRTFRAADPERAWMMEHLGRMVGAYIATVTAVSVVNLADVLPIASWLWPTAVGVPLILYWQAKYGDTGPFARLTAG